jgi:hypothetical protein
MSDDDDDSRLAEEWYERKTALLEERLGPEHGMVLHAMVPYAVGGSLDLYFFPQGIPGVGVATKELSELPGEGSANEVFDSYELVMFTRHPLEFDNKDEAATPFGRALQTISPILNCIARYSEQASLNPRETCEFPEEFETLGGKCLIFDSYGQEADEPADFGLLLVLEIHRSEMEYAREHGGQDLLDRLKEAGYYPYSDLDRPAVV